MHTLACKLAPCSKLARSERADVNNQTRPFHLVTIKIMINRPLNVSCQDTFSRCSVTPLGLTIAQTLARRSGSDELALSGMVERASPQTSFTNSGGLTRSFSRCGRNLVLLHR